MKKIIAPCWTMTITRNRSVKFFMSILCLLPPNDPSSATRRTGRSNCNRDAPAGFAAAHVRQRHDK